MSVEAAFLGEIATIIAGQSPPGSTYNESGSGLPFFQGKADFGRTHPVARKWCVAPKKIAEAGDILISVRAPVGPTNIAGERCCIGRGLAAIRPDKTIALRDFVHWMIKHREPELVTKGRGSTFVAIGQKDLNSLLIPLPPLDEQRRVASILNRAARIERQCARVNKSLRDFIPALFIKMFGDPIGNPMRWEQRRLGDMSAIQGGLQVTRKRTSHPLKKPYLRVANVLRDQLVLDEIKCIRLTDNELDRVRLQRNDLLIVEGHGNPGEIGRAAIWDGSVKDCVHQNHLIRARLNRDSLIPEFACTYLNSTSGRQHLLRSGKTTSGLNTISTSDVKACALFVPPLDLQNRFAGIVAAARDIAATTEAALDTASTLSASLMTRLLGNGA